jgi:hypothetical protein
MLKMKSGKRREANLENFAKPKRKINQNNEDKI